MMKKWIALLVALCMPAAALAQSAKTPVTANAVVKSRNVVQITAPCSGVLLPFEWETGDVVAKEDVLFELDTVKVYAPVSGTVRALFVQKGELAGDAMSEYGMLASIEKRNAMIVNASTNGAYNDEENRRVHAGEQIYLEESSDRDNVGTGRIISVSGNEYVVELSKGKFDDDVSVKIYREDTRSSKTCIGTGKTAYAADVPVAGSGRVVRVPVQEGDAVRKGDVLFEVLGADADGASSRMTAPVAGALELYVVPGAQVYKGQRLARVHDLEQMCVVASVDEMDLDLAPVGSTVSIVFDRYPDEVVIGTVREASAMGVKRQNAAYYDVTIDYFTSLETLPGMNATVTLNK